MNYIFYIIIGFSIIFIATSLGSAIIFFVKNSVSEKMNTIFLGFAGGIMVAASIWSLILPAIDQSSNLGKLSFLPVVGGFLLGSLFLVILDKVIPHFHPQANIEEGPKTKNINKATKMFLAITIHNIPEGLAVGFSFGSAYLLNTEISYIAALGLAIGIAIQNIPEGAAISLPLQANLKNKPKAFAFGVLSGIVEPIAAVLGFFLASYISFAQPWFLSFAAGAMIFVVVEDIIPDSKIEENPHLGTWSFIIGFCLMMILDVALG